MIIRSSRELKQNYEILGSKDIFIGVLPGGNHKHFMMIDLMSRGVSCFPSPLSQVLNGSKIAQSIILRNYLNPHTTAIFRRADLMTALIEYNRLGIDSVVTKSDKQHCGHGVSKWENMETLYSFISHTKDAYPFILQPFLEHFTDVRVIIAGDYIEAYERKNPHNFRQNMATGGTSLPHTMDSEKEEFCRRIMERGSFPYAHIDLQILDSGDFYLSEISLNGGIKGARIHRKALDQLKDALLDRLAGIDERGRKRT